MCDMSSLGSVSGRSCIVSNSSEDFGIYILIRRRKVFLLYSLPHFTNEYRSSKATDLKQILGKKLFLFLYTYILVDSFDLIH